ncbi:uncharacterized protein BN737_00038 [Clostridium sp. CAG:62]|nr:uncharacterized protein BN737_00038 [Clostridium sp. CAG:62]
MSLLKQLKWNLILLAVIFIALGIVLIFWPGATMKTICYLLAAMLLAIGVVSLINYLRKDISGIIYRYDLVVGLCAILGGILVIVKVDKLTDLIPAVLGFLVTMSGIMKMQNSVDMLRLGHGTWHVAFAMAIVNIVAGIVLLMNPFEAAQILIMCLGIALVYSGITDLYVTISISRRLSRLKTEIVVAEDDSEE